MKKSLGFGKSATSSKAVASIGLVALTLLLIPYIYLYENVTKLMGASLHNNSPHLWLDIVNYAEGIAGWKVSLLELLYLAQMVKGGATLVEPCMVSGRLGSCGRQSEHRRGIPVSEIFDLDEYMTLSDDGSYPLMVPYYDYQRILLGNTNMAKVCMAKNSKYAEKRCTKDASWIMEMKQNNIQRMLEDKGNQEHFILHMEDYWKGGVYELGWQLGMYILNDKQERFVKGMEIPPIDVATIPFHPKHEQFVDDLLQEGNITTNNFSVIHWRAEKKGMDFMRCARAINEAKHILLRKMKTNATVKEESSQQHKFVLMSSLNENEDMMWSGSRRIVNSTANGTTLAQHALQYLLRENGFIKIDGLLEVQTKNSSYNDLGMLAIYDLIIATKANNFATCTRDGCNKETKRLCDMCNHLGSFGRLAVSLREHHVDQRGSYECWPQ